jgi:hypothetical protein
MKKSSFIYFVVLTCVTVLACSKDSEVNPQVTTKSNSGQYYASNARFSYTDPITSGFIPIDSANKMINSYLYSINYSSNDSDVRSFTINADSLRAYLNSSGIKSIKISLAHTLAYINAGNEGRYAGYQSGALTIIISGYNSTGDYVYFNGSNVLDHASPCPTSCPGGSGTAVYDIFK